MDSHVLLLDPLNSGLRGGHAPAPINNTRQVQGLKSSISGCTHFSCTTWHVSMCLTYVRVCKSN